MKSLSANTVHIKTSIPLLWFGTAGLTFVLALLYGGEEQSILGLLVPGALFVLGFYIFKSLAWDLVDEVYYEGDALLFRKYGREQRVLLRDIEHLDDS